jgi:hypothetical protein
LERDSRWLLAGAVVAFAAIVYAPMLDVPFIGDDYVFLDKTRDATFGALWSFRNVDFGWYRPWSRELHFWTLQHLMGARETGFRVVSLLIWLAMLATYFTLLRRIRNERVAAIATLGAAGLALWGAPLTWISGVQDLWMLLFSMLTLWLVASGRAAWALAACAGALLSKETAAVLPLIVLAQARFIERLDWRRCARRVAPFVALTTLWLLLHPTLLHRVSHPAPQIPNGERPKPPAVVITESVLSTFNADRLALPVDPVAARAPGGRIEARRDARAHRRFTARSSRLRRRVVRDGLASAALALDRLARVLRQPWRARRLGRAGRRAGRAAPRGHGRTSRPGPAARPRGGDALVGLGKPVVPGARRQPVARDP